MTARYWTEPPDLAPLATVHVREHGDVLAGCYGAPDEQDELADVRAAALPKNKLLREIRAALRTA